MPFELLRRASMGQRSSRQIGQALSDRQIQPFDERGVQGRRVLGVGERFSDPATARPTELGVRPVRRDRFFAS